MSLIALFDTAIEGYRFLRSVAQNLPRDGRFLVTKFQVEEYRFALWGKYMGFSEADGCKNLFQLSKPTQALVLAMLTEVASIVADVETLKGRYGLVPSADSDTELQLDPRNILQSPSVINMEQRTRNHIDHRISKRKKWRWAIGDGARFAELVERLRYMNDSLHCLSPLCTRFLAQGLTMNMLPMIEDLSTLSDIHKATAATQPILATSAELKRVNIEVHSANFDTISEPPEIALNLLDIFETQGLRSMANYTNSLRPRRVLIEWKEIGKDIEEPLKFLLRKRIRALACLLATPKSADFHLLLSNGLVRSRAKLGGNFKHIRKIRLRLPTSIRCRFRLPSYHSFPIIES